MSCGFIYEAVEKCEEIGAIRKMDNMQGETNGAWTAVAGVRIASFYQ